MKRLAHFAAFAVLWTACQQGATAATIPNRPSLARDAVPGQNVGNRLATPFKHVVVIVMENRTVDNLFAGYYGSWPGLNVANPNGNPVLRKISFKARWDPRHDHQFAFVTEFRNGNQDGWAMEQFVCPPGGCGPNPTALAYVDPIEVGRYKLMAQRFGIADNVFQANEGASFPAHEYLIAGQSGGAFGKGHGWNSESENPPPHSKGGFGCNSTTTSQFIDMRSPYPGIEGPRQKFLPCLDYPTIFDLLDQRLPGPSSAHWTYRSPTENHIWSAPIAVTHLYQQYRRGATNFAVDPGGKKFIADLKRGQFPAVSYLIPCPNDSDHANSLSTTGPKWVSYVSNAVGESQFWKDSAIVVVWDDWGGWYDHVLTGHPVRNPYGNRLDPYEWGFRVPLIVMSPYAKAGLIDHTERSSSAILRFVESTFGLPMLGTDDSYANDDLLKMFDFKQRPLPWTHIDTGTYQPSAKFCG